MPRGHSDHHNEKTCLRFIGMLKPPISSFQVISSTSVVIFQRCNHHFHENESLKDKVSEAALAVEEALVDFEEANVVRIFALERFRKEPSESNQTTKF